MALTVRAFVATLFDSAAAAAAGALAPPPGYGPAEPPSDWLTWRDGPLLVRACPRDRQAVPPASDEPPVLLLGDPAEWDAADPDRNLVNVVPVRCDLARHTLTLHASIVGLPPVFVHRAGGTVSVASDLYLLAALPHVTLELDPTSVQQLGRTGHPVDHRTLFKDTRLVEGGTRLRVSREGGLEVSATWQFPTASPLAWPAFIDAQVHAFTDAVRRIDVSRSFLSLTAGLDTRAVFAMLAHQGRLVPSATMTGVTPSLDARTASTLCRHYGVPHQLVTFDEGFIQRLPTFVEQASRLSGGLESLEQAPEVYLYDQLRDGFAARISGNLGNQIGRGGTEGVGVRNASLEILSPALRERAADAGDDHWLLSKLDAGEAEALCFILQREIPFSSVGNFSVGNYFAMQQSPYANRGLLETLALKPRTSHAAPSASMFKMRLRDLRHRFLGEPARVSFQRTLLHEVGGFAADYPINLGWRATGGVSVPGLALGMATMAGMVAQKAGLAEGPGGRLVRSTGIVSLHNFRESRRWLRHHLRDFTCDTLAAQSLRDTGVFDHAALTRRVDAHFSGAADHHETVVFALDVALAHRTFCAAPSNR